MKGAPDERIQAWPGSKATRKGLARSLYRCKQTRNLRSRDREWLDLSLADAKSEVSSLSTPCLQSGGAVGAQSGSCSSLYCGQRGELVDLGRARAGQRDRHSRGNARRPGVRKEGQNFVRAQRRRAVRAARRVPLRDIASRTRARGGAR